LALIAFGVSFAFKLQSIFVALFFLALLLRGYIKLWQFLFVPLVYFVAVMPAWFLGRPLLDLFLIYGGQVGDNDDLTRNATNFYQWLPNENYAVVMPIGVMVTALIIVGTSWLVWQRKVTIEPNFLVTLFLSSVLVIPFFLPRMHDRYFFPADVGTILFAAYYPRYTWMPIVMQVASSLAYINGDLRFLLKYCSVGVAFVLFFVLRHLYQNFLAPSPQLLTPDLDLRA
jgi:Gpi18-like mannosyltransferase